MVLGASGGIGGAVTRELAARGHRVRAVDRRGRAEVPAGVERVAADASDPGDMREACAGADVVLHCAQPDYTRWPQDFPPITAAVAEAAEGAGAKLVFADNLYMYGPPDGPLREDSPVRPRGRKGRVRAEMAADLLGRHASGRLRVAIGRASDYYGEGGRGSALGDVVFGRIATGKRPRWLGPLDVPHSEHYLGDVARGLATLAEEDAADGEVWHLPAADPLTGRQFLELAREEAEVALEPQTTPSALLRVGGVFSPMLRELGETAYQWQRPFTIDATKFTRAFDPPPPTPHRQAVRRTVEWFAERAARAGRADRAAR